jgi:predicted MFS family arabinose efflux permease
MFALFKRPPVVFGLVTVSLLFVGQFSLFTYLRPFLEQVTHVSVTMLSVMLLILGAAGFIGTVLIGRVLDKGLYAALGVLPAAMAVVAAMLALTGGSTVATAVLLAVWGFAGTVPDEAEAGGGLMVAVVQLAITLGATFGGLVFDAGGPRIEFLSSAALLAVAAIAAFSIGRLHGRPAAA